MSGANRDYFKEQTTRLIDQHFIKCGLCGALITKSKTCISSHLSRNHKQLFKSMDKALYKGFEEGSYKGFEAGEYK